MRIETDIPFSLADVDKKYLRHTLRQAGFLRDKELISFELKVIGEEVGFLGEIARITLEHDCEHSPRSVILKIPTSLVNNRRTGQLLRAYENEIRFYSMLAPIINVRVPAHYYSALDVVDDPQQGAKAIGFINAMPLWLVNPLLAFFGWLGARGSRRYVLLMEDLGCYRLGDQVAGCSLDDAKKGIEAMAKLHAQFWNSEAIAEQAWILPVADLSKIQQAVYVKGLPKYLAANEGQLAAGELRLLNWLREHGVELLAAATSDDFTLLHRDFRLDNLCFDDATGEVVLFDWQTMVRGPAGMDLAYFVSAALTSDADRDAESALVTHYVQQLQARGVDVSAARIEWEYQIGMMVMLQTLIPARFQTLLDLGEDRGPQLIDAWLERILHKLADFDPSRLLKDIPD